MAVWRCPDYPCDCNRVAWFVINLPVSAAGVCEFVRLRSTWYTISINFAVISSRRRICCTLKRDLIGFFETFGAKENNTWKEGGVVRTWRGGEALFMAEAFHGWRNSLVLRATPWNAIRFTSVSHANSKQKASRAFLKREKLEMHSYTLGAFVFPDKNVDQLKATRKCDKIKNCNKYNINK